MTAATLPFRLMRILRLVLPCLALLIAGCSQTSEPFRVGTNVWIGYESLYLARSIGRYDDTPIQLVEMNNTTEVMNALRAGVLEAAAMTLDEALSVKQDGFDIRIVLIMDSSQGGDVLLARPKFSQLSDLRGHHIGVESSAVGAILLQGALESAGMSSKNVEIVYLPANQHAKAFDSEKIDAVVTFEPMRSTLLAKGAHQLFDSSRIPGRIVDVLVTSGDAINKHPDSLKRLISGHFSALRYLREHPADAAQYMAPRAGMQINEFLHAFDGIAIPDLAENRRLLAADPPALSDNARALIRLMVDHKMLRQEVDIRGIFDGRWLPDAT